MERARRQITFANQASFEKYARPSRRGQFLGIMEAIVPRTELEALIAPYYRNLREIDFRRKIDFNREFSYFRLLSRICGRFPVPAVFQVCDRGPFPSL
jgi:hypothetical protein